MKAWCVLVVGVVAAGAPLVIGAQTCTTTKVRFARTCATTTVEGVAFQIQGPPLGPVPYLQACQQLAANVATPAFSSACQATGQLAFASASGSMDPGNVCRVHITKVNGSTSGMLSNANVTNGVPCPPAGACDADFPGVGDQFTSTVNPGSGSSYCHALSKCKVEVRSTVGMDGATLYTWKHTSSQCAQSQAESSAGAPGENCITGSSGAEFCSAGQGEKNCGFINDQYVCLGQTESDGCHALGDGGRVCGPQAPTPPRPDNGTAGVPAPPDQVLQIDNLTTQTTNNYFNSATVANSARPVGSGDNPNDGEDDGSGAGPGEGEGGENSGLTCDPSSDEDCDGDGAASEGDDPRSGWQCWAAGEGMAGAVASCFSTASQTMWNAIKGSSQLIQIAEATAAAVPSGGGACPSAPVELLQETFDLWDVPCDFLGQVESVLGPLFLLMWSFMGLRILLSIPGG